MDHPLRGRRILVVDDEADVRETIALVLSDCDLDTADSYASAREKLSKNRYDLAVLDIMGVRGYDLLEEFAWALPCVMLTAHALSPKDLEQSMVKRAVLYLPKDEMGRLDAYLEKLLENRPLAKPYPAPWAGGHEPVFHWLFEKLEFKRWFGDRWTPPKS